MIGRDDRAREAFRSARSADDWPVIVDTDDQVGEDLFFPGMVGVRRRATALYPDGVMTPVGCIVRVSQEMLDDAPAIGAYLEERMARSFDRTLRPWLYPDPPAIAWSFDPFPRWAALTKTWSRSASWCRRLRWRLHAFRTLRRRR